MPVMMKPTIPVNNKRTSFNVLFFAINKPKIKISNKIERKNIGIIIFEVLMLLDVCKF